MFRKFSIFHIEGGIGKNIMATSVISSLKKSDPEREIIIVTAWNVVWFNNPNVSEIWTIGHLQNFYKNYILNKDVKIFRLEPYHTEDYILKRDHLIRIWCNMIGVEWDGSGPQLYFSDLEMKFIGDKILKGVEKPILLLHPNGGVPNNRPYSWYRDIPIENCLDIVDYFKEDYHIYQIGWEGHQKIEGTHTLLLDNREILASPFFSRKRLLIDSFSQHASTYWGRESVVCWVGNSPDILGYGIHKNIKPSSIPIFDTLHSSYLEDAEIGGNPIQFPYKETKIFDSQEIIDALLEIKN
jgi:hypothetical protein